MYKKKIKGELEKDGYKVSFFDIDYNNVSICMVNVDGSRQTYCKIKNSPIYYYIIEGRGIFKIEEEIEVKERDFIEIPANQKYTYKGNMKLMEIIPNSFENLDFEEDLIK